MPTTTVRRSSSPREETRGTAEEHARSNDGGDRLAGWLQRAPWRTVEPAPGTLAARNPEPDIVTVARVMILDGDDIADVVDELLRLESSQTSLQAAKTFWVRQLGRGPSDDFAGHRVLKALEQALRSSRDRRR